MLAKILERIGHTGGNQVESDITSDVWGRPKMVHDYSLLRAAFFFGINPLDWITVEDGSEIYPATKTVVGNGAATISSGATIGESNLVETRRHPRYQPNRGHLLSTALFLPNPTATGKRQLGFMCPDYKACFELENGVLYAVIINKAGYKVKEPIDLGSLGMSIENLQYGTLYDIQYQWRGVGDYFFYLNQKLAYKTNFLGNNTEMTIANPTMSAGFYCENTDGTEVSIVAGCVDISSEGGKENSVSYVSVANDSPLLIATDVTTPVLMIHVKEDLVGEHNTRDVQAYRIVGNFSKDSYMKAWYTRDPSAISGAVFGDAAPNSGVEYAYNGATIDTNKCQLLWNRFMKTEQSTILDLPSPKVDFYLTSGDYLIITGDGATNYNAVVSLEMGEEI